MKKIKTKEPKQSIKTVVSNNLFMLKIVAKAAPWYIPCFFISTILWSSIDFISNAFMLRYVVNGVQDGRDFNYLATSILAILAAEVFISILSRVWWNLIEPRLSIRISESIDSMILDKATAAELSCFETPEFYDKYIKALNVGGQKAFDVMNTLNNVIYRIITLSANAFLIFTIDPYLIFFALIPLLLGFIVKRNTKIRADRNLRKKEIDRRSNYARRVFYMGEYAKEMRLGHSYRVMFEQFRKATEDIIALWRTTAWKTSPLEYLVTVGREVFTILGATLYSVYRVIVTKTMKYGDGLIVINKVFAWGS